MERVSGGYTNVDKICVLGKTYYRVPRSKYRLAERIRNYILRTEYETGQSVFILKLKAAKLFGVSDEVVNEALKDYKKWFYGNGIIHRPVEKFIEDDKQERMKGKVLVNIV